MSRRLPAFALAGVALLLTVSVALPLAAADHTYSHRFVLYGRVVDANGDPVPGLTLNAAPQLFEAEGACRASTGSDLGTDAYGPTVYNPVTDAHGDFVFCFHTHTMNRVEPGRLVVRIEDIPEFAPVTLKLDSHFRSIHTVIRLPDAHPNANAGAVAEQYTVIGRLWREAAGDSVNIDGVKVFGETLNQEPIDIKLLDPQGNVVGEYNTTTNDYGDFAVRVPTESRFTEGTVQLSAGGKNFTQPATKEGVTYFAADYAPPESNVLKNVLWVGMWVVVVGAVVGGGYWGIHKFTEARELEQARQTSTRKRAKK